MEPMTIQEIAAAVDGKWLNPRENAPAVTAVCTDNQLLFETLQSGNVTAKFTLENVVINGEPVSANDPRVNVIYAGDGVKGKAFKDQVYSDLEAGTDTPKFDGKPTRKGYTFTGWSPKVTDTVTKDVTYVAQWKSVKNGKDNIPKTGDSEIVMVLGSVLLFSFCGAAAVSVYDRKRKHF